MPVDMAHEPLTRLSFQALPAGCGAAGTTDETRVDQRISYDGHGSA